MDIKKIDNNTAEETLKAMHDKSTLLKQKEHLKATIAQIQNRIDEIDSTLDIINA